MVDPSLRVLLDAVRTGAIPTRIIQADEQELFSKEVRGRRVTTAWYDSNEVQAIGSVLNAKRYPYSALFFVDEKGITTTPVRMHPTGYTNPVLGAFVEEVNNYRASLEP